MSLSNRGNAKLHIAGLKSPSNMFKVIEITDIVS